MINRPGRAGTVRTYNACGAHDLCFQGYVPGSKL